MSRRPSSKRSSTSVTSAVQPIERAPVVVAEDDRRRARLVEAVPDHPLVALLEDVERDLLAGQRATSGSSKIGSSPAIGSTTPITRAPVGGSRAETMPRDGRASTSRPRGCSRASRARRARPAGAARAAERRRRLARGAAARGREERLALLPVERVLVGGAASTRARRSPRRRRRRSISSSEQWRALGMPRSPSRARRSLSDARTSRPRSAARAARLGRSALPTTSCSRWRA